MNQHRNSQRTDSFTALLFRLPAELRLQIYEYLGTPGLSNRRSFRWLDISRPVFLDAGPHFYSTKPLYFWIDARNSDQGRSLDGALRHHIKSVHPENAKWAFDVVRSSMLTKVMLEVHARTVGENLQSLLLRFADMSFQFRKYTALEQVYISLRPHYNNAHHKALFKSFKYPHLRERTVRDSWTMRRLCRAARQIKTQLPAKCNVKFYFPGETLPKVPYKLGDLGDYRDPRQVMDSELDVIVFMENLWAFISDHSDEELDGLLSECDSKPIWEPKQSR